jgi:hypothetical protein
MPSIRELLDSATSAGIAELHSLHLGRAGIVQSSRIRTELENWLSDPVRRERYISENPGVKELFAKLAFAGSAGFSEPADIEPLSRELMAFRPVGDQTGWYVLSDWAPALRAQWLASHAIAAPPPRQDALPSTVGWVEGVAGLSARIDLGQGRLNRSGELNRRDRPALRSCFFHLAHLPEDAAELCLDLTLAFLSGRQWIVSRSGRLECHEEMVQALSDPLDWIRWIRHWWMRLSLPEGDSWWEQVSRSVLSGNDALRVWSWLDGNEAPESGRAPGWKELPARLRQAVALGLLEADLEEGLVVRIRPGDEDPLPSSDKPLTCTADFLVYLGPGTSPNLRRGLEAMSIREQSGRISRYRLSKEAVLAMSASPLLGPFVQDMIETLDPPATVRRTLAEWMLARRTCQFETLRVLRVRDAHRHQELAALPQVAGLVRETIPGWGFVVDPGLEPELRKVLSTLGYDPPALEQDAEPALPWTPPDPPTPYEPLRHEEWHLSPQPGDEHRRTAVGSGSKYGEILKELPFSDLLRVSEYAILTDTDVEAILKGSGPRAVRFKILRLDKRKEPVSVEIRTQGSRESREIPLDTIKKIRIVE